MKRLIILAFAIGITMAATAQLNIAKTEDVMKPVYSNPGILTVNLNQGAYYFNYFNQTGRPRTFVMENIQSAKDLISLAKKMVADNKITDSYTFSKGTTVYQMSWLEAGKLTLYIIPAGARGDMWMIDTSILNTINFSVPE